MVHVGLLEAVLDCNLYNRLISSIKIDINDVNDIIFGYLGPSVKINATLKCDLCNAEIIRYDFNPHKKNHGLHTVTLTIGAIHTLSPIVK